MKDNDFNKIIERSIKIREKYHDLEKIHHEKEWIVEEDALAFLTDAGLVGRLTMANQGRWLVDGEVIPDLEHKLAESMWWIIVLSKRMNIDINESMEKFLHEKEEKLGE